MLIKVDIHFFQNTYILLVTVVTKRCLMFICFECNFPRIKVFTSYYIKRNISHGIYHRFVACKCQHRKDRASPKFERRAPLKKPLTRVTYSDIKELIRRLAGGWLLSLYSSTQLTLMHRSLPLFRSCY